MKISSFTLLLLSLLVVAQANSAEDISGDISHFGDAVHAEFQGRKNWDYNFRREGRSLILSLPHVNAATIEKFKAWSSDVVDKVSVQEGHNNGHDITFHVTSEAIDSFDYLTDQPSHLVIDFYKKKDEKPSLREIAEMHEAPKKAGSTKGQVPLKLPVKKGRTPASEILPSKVEDHGVPVPTEVNLEKEKEAQQFGIFDGGDPNFSRFEMKDHEFREDAIIASRQNFYLNFPMLELEPTSLKELWETPPIYEIKPEDNDENKKARLLLTLFNKKRFAVFLKTMEFFEKDYPASKYKEIIKFMEADIYNELWKKSLVPSDFGSAMSRYQALLEEFPESVLAERTSLLIGYSYFGRGDYLGALKALQRFTKQFPNSTHIPRVKLAMAESYLSIKSHAETIKILNELESDVKSGEYGVAAAFKKGDVYFKKGEFQNAVDEYQKSVKKYSKYVKEYPNAFYNLSESLFHLKNYRESLKGFSEFLNRFPRNSYGGYAMTRVGELLEILGADQKKVNGAFLESIFRYKGSPGAGVARVRLIRERMADMKPKEVESALGEIKAFSEKAELPKVNEFSVIMATDGLSRRKDFRKTIGQLIEYYQSHPSGDLGIFTSRIVDNIAAEMHYQVQENKFLDALKTYGEYSSIWLKNTDRIDIDYFLGQSFEKSGLYDEASQHYRKALNSLYAIAGTPKEREKQLKEFLPVPEQVLLRLAAMSWSKGDTSKTYEYLENIRTTDHLSPDEKIERVELAAQVSIAKGQFEPAKKYLTELVDTWKGQPSKVALPLFTIADLEARDKNYKESNRNLDHILRLDEDSSEVQKELIVKSLKLKADNLVALNEVDSAISAHKLLLEKFESTHPLDSTRYRLGMLQFQKGNLVEAEKVWSSFKPDSVWSHLAKEEMNHSKWKDSYKKYIDRVPAMAGERSGAKEIP